MLQNQHTKLKVCSISFTARHFKVLEMLHEKCGIFSFYHTYVHIRVFIKRKEISRYKRSEIQSIGC